MLHYLLSFFLLIALTGCDAIRPKTYRVGVDPSWFPLDTSNKEPNLFAFTNDILKEIQTRKHIRIERVVMSWDNLLDGLDTDRYDAILTTMKPTIINQKQYRFSSPFIYTGAVLVVQKGSDIDSLEELSGQILQVSKGSSMLDYMSKYPEIELQFYNNLNDCLEDVIRQKAKAALVPVIPLASYVHNLYFDQLKMICKSITGDGIRMVNLEKKEDHLIHLFNQTIEDMRKDGSLDKLAKKWSVPDQCFMQ